MAIFLRNELTLLLDSPIPIKLSTKDFFPTPGGPIQIIVKLLGFVV